MEVDSEWRRFRRCLLERLRRKLENWVEQQVLYYSAPEIYRAYAPPRPDRSAGAATR